MTVCFILFSHKLHFCNIPTVIALHNEALFVTTILAVNTLFYTSQCLLRIVKEIHQIFSETKEKCQLFRKWGLVFIKFGYQSYISRRKLVYD